ncbi:hypothetical protein AVEN_67223-1 [Araneus ventricosus]|uniref:Uncharacterized protein n=1 Tax=Araneus ventricosus TaxID=182803 RepID=A0A4Y2X9D6_ARAVE|nr:hypothetical protein AVEN_67223-1 [Araneus ventricosus]
MPLAQHLREGPWKDIHICPQRHSRLSIRNLGKFEQKGEIRHISLRGDRKHSTVTTWLNTDSVVGKQKNRVIRCNHKGRVIGYSLNQYLQRNTESEMQPVASRGCSIRWLDLKVLDRLKPKICNAHSQ